MKKTLPPTYFFGAIVLAVVLHFLFPLAQLVSFPWRLLGLAPLALGVALNLVTDQAFKRRETTVKPFEVSNALITDGFYGVSRNPMYLGMVLILLGIALLLGTFTPFLAPCILAILFDRVFIVPEERMLEEIFGETFREYKKRVRRWI